MTVSASHIAPLSVEPADSAVRVSKMLTTLQAITEPGRGVTRLAYSPLERAAHDLFATWMEEFGLRVTVDSAGNTIAERPGTKVGWPALGTGSHLDSVPNGGGFDGIVGVVAAVEVARILGETGTAHRHPLRFVAFSAEEGARFGQACTGSRLAAGLCRRSDLLSCRDDSGVSIFDAMARLGLDPEEAVSSPWVPTDWAAFLELHIEQGGVLEECHIPIGIVDLVSGSTRVAMRLNGVASHTGGTPMRGRADALVGAAEVILYAEAIANDHRHRGTRATVGRLDVSPGSITTIPGMTRLSLDVRDIDSDRQRNTTAEIVRRARDICDRRGIELHVELLADASPIVLSGWIRAVVARAATDARASYRVLTSGASHDAQMISHVIPSGMIFVPSERGRSHVPEERTSIEQIVVGVDVLRRSLLRLDDELSETSTTTSCLER